MDITAEQILADYVGTAQQVMDYYYALPAQEQTQHEATQSVLYGWVQGCQQTLGLVAMTPSIFEHSSSDLVVDAWGWIPAHIKEQMKAEQHPMYMAACECGEQ